MDAQLQLDRVRTVPPHPSARQSAPSALGPWPSALPIPPSPAPRAHHAFIVLTVLLLAIPCAAPALAQLPRARLYALFPAGAQAGTTVDVQVAAGDDLDGLTTLQFSHPGITAVQKVAEPQPNWPMPRALEDQYAVTIAADVPPGVYEVRALGLYGISNARRFAVGDRPETIEPDNNDAFERAAPLEIGKVINGRVGQAKIDYFTFTAHKGQRLLIDCHAERIDSRLHAALTLSDAQGRELARTRNPRGADPLIDFTAPADGQYIVQVFDSVYEGGNDAFYRLLVSDGPYVDFIFPPVAAPQAKATVTLYGRNLPDGSAAPDVVIDGQPLEKLEVTIDMPAPPTGPLSSAAIIRPIEATIDLLHYRLATPRGQSNAVPMAFATAPIVLEQAGNDSAESPQQVTPPCQIAGQFHPARDLDWYVFQAEKGRVYEIEVIAGRLGSLADPHLLIQQLVTDDKGETKARDLADRDDTAARVGTGYFDTSTDDPAYTFTAPDDGAYRLLVRDLYGTSRGDPRLVYLLSIRQRQPDFRLIAVTYERRNNNVYEVSPWPVLLRRGGNEEVQLIAVRRDGFDGDIAISVENLPAGVSCAPGIIPANRDSAPVLLHAADDAPASIGAIRIIGKAKIGDAEVVREARAGEVQWPGRQNQNMPSSRITGAVMVAVDAGFVFPYALELPDGPRIETARGGKVELPVTLTRRDGYKEKIDAKVEHLPKQIKIDNRSIAADKSDGKLEVQVDSRIEPGAYVALIMADGQVEFVRNSGAADEAEQAIKKIEELLTQRREAVKQAEQAKQSAEQAFATAQQEQRTARDTAAQASEDARPAAQQALSAADEKLKSAEQAREAAQKALEEAAQQLKFAEEAQRTANDRANKAKETAKPKKLNVSMPAQILVIEVAAAPFGLQPPAPQAPLKQGETIELPASIERKYGFDDEVTLELESPKGVNGVRLDGNRVSIAKDQTQATLKFVAEKDATPGTHRFNVKSRYRFNNQNLEYDQPFELTIEAVEQAKQ